MDSHFAIAIVVVVFVLIHDWRKSRRAREREEKAELLIRRIREIKEEARRGAFWMNLDRERAFLEGRLIHLLSAYQYRKSANGSNEGDDESWREAVVEDNEDEQWFDDYCCRQIEEIRRRLEDIDIRDSRNRRLFG